MPTNVYVAAVRLTPNGTGSEHITELIAVKTDYQGFKHGVGVIVNLIESRTWFVKVRDTAGETEVKVVRAPNGNKYLRSHKDGRETDNLLNLAKY